MNYRHDYHAGNFADVFKHVILSRALAHLTEKPAALRFIDTHAGHGLYDLGEAAAQKTREWEGGIGRLLAADVPTAMAALLQPYRTALDAHGAPQAYPGSPLIAAALLRGDDRLLCCEAHPETFAALAAATRRDRRIKALAMDGYGGLNAFVPPRERRGLVLIDPPYEARDEFFRAGATLAAAWRKWPTGTYMLWHPRKAAADVETLLQSLENAGLRRVLHLDLQVDTPREEGSLAANGLVIVNPPYRLADEAAVLLPWLARCMARGDAATARVTLRVGD